MSDNAYNGRVSQVENQTTPSLRDRLGTARNAFRVYALVVKSKVRVFFAYRDSDLSAEQHCRFVV